MILTKNLLADIKSKIILEEFPSEEQEKIKPRKKLKENRDKNIMIKIPKKMKMKFK